MADVIESYKCVDSGLDLVVFEAYAVMETEKALCVVIEGEQHWIPHSMIHDDSEVWQKRDKGRLVLSRWMAEKKGLIDD